MNIFGLLDLYHQTARPFHSDVNNFLKDIKNPRKFVEDLIKKEMKRQGIEPRTKESTAEQIMNFIKINNIITTGIAINEGFIKQTTELKTAVTTLSGNGFKIHSIVDRKPHIYYYGISKDEALRRMKKEPKIGGRKPDVYYGNKDMRGI